MNVAIIAAAGKSERMGGANKQFLPLLGVPVLARTLLAFERSPHIEKIIVVIEKSETKRFEDSILAKYGVTKILETVDGGKERQDSVLNGLRSLPGETTRVLIHDGARPLVTPELISRLIEALPNWQGVVAAVPLKDTIKRVDSEQGIIETIERTDLWAAQTPQVFLPKTLMEAHQRARMDGFYGTDDSVLLERLGYKVKVVMGSYENVKITTPDDLPVAEAILGLRTTKESGQR